MATSISMAEAYFIRNDDCKTAAVVCGTEIQHYLLTSFPGIFPFITSNSKGQDFIVTKDSTDKLKVIDSEQKDSEGNSVIITKVVPIQNEIATPLPSTSEAATVATPSSNNENALVTISSQKTWTREKILMLIQLYGEHRPMFKSNSIANSVAWKSISEKLGVPVDKVTHKWQYLKGKYTKKKDSMGVGNSGGTGKYFEYFNEMDEILREDPNITPPIRASSRHPANNVPPASSASNENIHPSSDPDDNSEIVDDPGLQPPAAKKAKKSKSNSSKRMHQRDALLSLLEKKEANAEARHKEKMKRQDAALKALTQLTNILINVTQQPEPEHHDNDDDV